MSIRRKIIKNKTRRINGGKSFSEGNVKLQYKNKDIKCSLCGENNYEEVIGSINKSKVRTGVRNFIFGSDSGDIDNTSVITYFCNTCGFCLMIRNKDYTDKITVTKV